jgi:murein DD-endopeptidase MepM/ murein hydrolase activator NlpD
MHARTTLSIAAGTLLLAVVPAAASATAATAPAAPRPVVATAADQPVHAAQAAPAPAAEPAPAPQPAPAPAPSPRDPRQFINPVNGGHIISPFGYRSGRRHEGTDYKGPNHTPVFATFQGTVIQAGPGLRGYGNTVTIDHGQGVITMYAHLFSVSARRGQVVAQGDTIGLEGQTGSASTYHVHYEVKVDGRKVDPAPYLRS